MKLPFYPDTAYSKKTVAKKYSTKNNEYKFWLPKGTESTRPISQN